jgi:hypothetical protein
LKPIDLEGRAGNFVTEILRNMFECDKEIWTDRISYFQSRGIHLAIQSEIQKKRNLRNKLAKEQEVTWRFQFFQRQNTLHF